MAVPVYAQNKSGNTGDASNSPSTSTTANAPAANTDAGTAAGTNTMVGGGKYANVGMGNYMADQQYITGGNANNNNAGNNNNNNWRPSQRNPVLADNADARASKVIGTNVYNSNNQKLGSVDDIILGTNGVFAVISTNNKQVAVPFGDLMFGNATNEGDEKVVIPQETQARLNTLPMFRYDASNYPGVNADNFKAGGVNVASDTSGGAGTGVNAGPAGAGMGVGVGGVGANAGAGPGGNAGNGNGGPGTVNR
jgi:sporulation protein YlmC with PRC-barrel domain